MLLKGKEIQPPPLQETRFDFDKWRKITSTVRRRIKTSQEQAVLRHIFWQEEFTVCGVRKTPWEIFNIIPLTYSKEIPPTCKIHSLSKRIPSLTICYNCLKRFHLQNNILYTERPSPFTTLRRHFLWVPQVRFPFTSFSAKEIIWELSRGTEIFAEFILQTSGCSEENIQLCKHLIKEQLLH